MLFESHFSVTGERVESSTVVQLNSGDGRKLLGSDRVAPTIKSQILAFLTAELHA
jgi:hypothetical protein